MITFSQLEKKGHLGNQLFQIASTVGIAKKNGHDFSFPEWKYAPYFEYQLPILKNTNFINYKEESFHYYDIQLDIDKNYDLNGWFQTEKYFNLEKVKEVFTLKKTYKEKVKTKYKSILKKETIFISIRRGDFVDHPDYFQLSIDYYLNALITYFKNWSEYHIIVTSDDIQYCKYHFSNLTNVLFLENVPAIEQLALASFCNNFIISNSTFSWWCAWFGDSQNTLVIRPEYNFTKEKNSVDNDKDYYPDRWINFKHQNKKIDLSDVIFLLNKKNDILEYHLKHNFNIKKIVYDNMQLSKNIVQNTTKIVRLNNYILPPLSLYNTIVNTNKSAKCITLKKSIKISKILDLKRVNKQWDFGIFTKNLAKKKNLKKNKVLFSVYNSLDDFFERDQNKNFEYISSSNSIIMGSVFFCKVYLDYMLTKSIKSFKKFIKKKILNRK